MFSQHSRFFPTHQSMDHPLGRGWRCHFTALLRDGVDRYGIPGESAERWIESISSRPEDKGDFALAPGTSTGLDVIYDLRYDGAKDVQVIIVHVARPHRE